MAWRRSWRRATRTRWSGSAMRRCWPCCSLRPARRTCRDPAAGPGEDRMTDPALPVHGVGEPRREYATLCAMFDDAVATSPDAVALRHMAASVTYREEGQAVAALARRLAALAAPGEIVALLLPNSIEFCV